MMKMRWQVYEKNFENFLSGNFSRFKYSSLMSSIERQTSEKKILKYLERKV